LGDKKINKKKKNTSSHEEERFLCIYFEKMSPPFYGGRTNLKKIPCKILKIIPLLRFLLAKNFENLPLWLS